MLNQTTSEATLNATSLPESEYGHSLYDELIGPTTGPSGQEAALASLSPAQAKEKGLLTSGTYGPHGSTLSESKNLSSYLESRLRVKTASLGSTLYKLTWKRRATPSGGGDLCSAGVGAPHIRQRLYFVAEGLGDAFGERLEGFTRDGHRKIRWAEPDRSVAEASGVDRLADNQSERRNRGQNTSQPARGPSAETGSAAIRMAHCNDHRQSPSRRSGQGRRHEAGDNFGRGGETGRLGHPGSEPSERNSGSVHRQERESDSQWVENGSLRDGYPNAGDLIGMADTAGIRQTESTDGEKPDRQFALSSEDSGPGPVNGFWRDSDWLFCRDGKWRPVRSGTFPLVNGATERVGRLRAYGNAINAELTKIFIETYLEVEEERRLGIADLI